MNEFKKILDFEASYDKKVSKAKQDAQKKLDKLQQELESRLEQDKLDLVASLELESKQKEELARTQAQEIIVNGQDRAQHIKQRADMSKGVELLMEAVKNV